MENSQENNNLKTQFNGLNMDSEKSMLNLDAQKKLYDYVLKKSMRMAGLIFLVVIIFFMTFLYFLGVFK